MKPTDSRSAYRIARILDLLLDEDLDHKQITQKIGMTRPASIAKYLKHLKSRHKIHVCKYRQRGRNGHAWAVYRWGKGINADPPPVKPKQQIMREWRAKRKANVRMSQQTATAG